MFLILSVTFSIWVQSGVSIHCIGSVPDWLNVIPCHNIAPQPLISVTSETVELHTVLLILHHAQLYHHITTLILWYRILLHEYSSCHIYHINLYAIKMKTNSVINLANNYLTTWGQLQWIKNEIRHCEKVSVWSWSYRTLWIPPYSSHWEYLYKFNQTNHYYIRILWVKSQHLEYISQQKQILVYSAMSTDSLNYWFCFLNLFFTSNVFRFKY